jgi:phosphatidylserine synthase
MKKYNKYIPFFIGIVFLTIFSATKEAINQEWIGIIFLFIGIILVFELIESSRLNRIKKWDVNRPSKIKQILKFSLLLGLPISAIIIFIIHSKSDLVYSILFIAVPLIIIFGWIGLLDWKSCDKINLEEKYKVTL